MPLARSQQSRLTAFLDHCKLKRDQKRRLLFSYICSCCWHAACLLAGGEINQFRCVKLRAPPRSPPHSFEFASDLGNLSEKRAGSNCAVLADNDAPVRHTDISGPCCGNAMLVLSEMANCRSVLPALLLCAISGACGTVGGFFAAQF